MHEHASCLGMVIAVVVLVLGFFLISAYDPKECVAACGEGQVKSSNVFGCVCR